MFACKFKHFWETKINIPIMVGNIAVFGWQQLPRYLYSICKIETVAIHDRGVIFYQSRTELQIFPWETEQSSLLTFLQHSLFSKIMESYNQKWDLKFHLKHLIEINKFCNHITTYVSRYKQTMFWVMENLFKSCKSYACLSVCLSVCLTWSKVIT